MAPSIDSQVTVHNMNPCVKKMEYAVRGPLVIRASALEQELKEVRQEYLLAFLHEPQKKQFQL